MIRPLYHHGWYLQYLFLWYVIFFTIRRTPLFDSHRILLFSIISVILFSSLQGIKAEQSLSFLLGVILSEKRRLQEKVFRLRYGLILFGFGVVCLAAKQVPVIRTTPRTIINLVQLGIKLPIGVGLMILVKLSIGQMKHIQSLLWAVGTISYELYLIHGYVLQFVPVSFFGAVVFVILTSCISMLLWYVIKCFKPLLLKIFKFEF